MCGRYALNATSQELIASFGLVECPDFDPRYNIAPIQSVPIIRQRATGERVAHLLRWGLLPSWAKDETLATRLINARAETIGEKPAFRAAYKARRCLVPASGYFEWKAIPGGKQPYFIHATNGSLLAFAGLWERWNKPDGSPLDTFTVITRDATETLRSVHDRMPVILAPENYGPWLSRETPAELVHQILISPAEDTLTMFPVSKIVGNVKNDTEECLVPIAEGEEPALS